MSLHKDALSKVYHIKLILCVNTVYICISIYKCKSYFLICFFFLDASFYLCECSHNLSQREITSARNSCFNQFKDSSHFFLFRVLYVIVDEEQPFFIRVKWTSNSYNASSLIMTVFLFQIKKTICWDLNSRFRQCNYSGRRTLYVYIYIVMVYINICVFDMFIV
jgi:hypothetical protein